MTENMKEETKASCTDEGRANVMVFKEVLDELDRIHFKLNMLESEILGLESCDEKEISSGSDILCLNDCIKLTPKIILKIADKMDKVIDRIRYKLLYVEG